jgi:hypothetical protein
VLMLWHRFAWWFPLLFLIKKMLLINSKVKSFALCSFFLVAYAAFSCKEHCRVLEQFSHV